jgi:hypothetical protein
MSQQRITLPGMCAGQQVDAGAREPMVRLVQESLLCRRRGRARLGYDLEALRFKRWEARQQLEYGTSGTCASKLCGPWHRRPSLAGT